MEFRTAYTPRHADFILDPSHPVVTLGSCFADNIAGRMRKCLWNAQNPLGTLYNPLSIERAISISLFSGDYESEFNESLVEQSGVCHSWLFDSRVSDRSCDGCLDNFICEKELFSDMLEKAQALFVTFGTSWCYFLSDRQDYVVANCHKFPSATFSRRRLSVDEITRIWTDLASRLRERYPQLRIVFTVSPVRHIKDGLEGNALSKATLLLAVEEICSHLDFCSYFPAYEILTDDLRDYRFYADDLVHPSDKAVDYIWEIFKATYLDSDGEKLLKEGENIVKGYGHRPLLAIKEETEKFRLKIMDKYNNLISRHPDMLDLAYLFPDA